MKRVTFISNDFTFLPFLKKLKRNYAGSVEYFMHSEKETEPDAFDMRSISKLNEYLFDADFIIPLFDGIKGVYLLRNLITSVPFSRRKIIRIENVLINYVRKDSCLFSVEASIKETFEKHVSGKPSLQFVLLENKMPSFLNNANAKAILKNFIISPYNFFEFLLENIAVYEALSENKIVFNSMPESYEIEMMSEYLTSQIEKRSIVEKFNALFDNKFGERKTFVALLKRFLSDLASGKISNICEIQTNVSFGLSKSLAN